MKKLLLSIAAFSFAFGVNAQDLTDGDENFTIPFSSSTYCLATCCNGTIADLYYAAGGNVNQGSSTLTAGSYKTIRSTSSIDGSATPMFLDIYANTGGGCNPARGNAGIDMSTNKGVRIKVSASAAATIQFFMADFSLNLANNGSSTYNINSAGGSVIKTINVTTTSTDYTLDYSGDADFNTWAGRTGIDMWGIIVTSGAGVDIRFEEIEFGVATTSSASAQVDNSAINLFPNPSNGAVNVDLSQFSGASNVVVMNNAGQTVATYSAEGTLVIPAGTLNKGMYLVQVSNENKVATKKLVIE